MPKRKSMEQEDGGEGGEETNYLVSMPVKATGAMAGIRLVGHRPRTKAVLLSFENMIRPLRSCLDKIKGGGQWLLFVERCRKLPGFLEFSAEQMASWLEKNASDESTFFGEKERVFVHHAGTSTSQFLLMGNVAGQSRTVQELEKLIPRPSKTKPGKKHTLVFHRGGFCIAPPTPEKNIEDNAIAASECKLLLDLESGEEVTMKTQCELEQIMSKKKFIHITPTTGVFYESAQKKPPSIPCEKNLGKIGLIINQMDSGELKSLLQKLIRYASYEVRLGDEEKYCTRDVLMAVMQRAALHSGGFVPSLQTFVPGLISFLKRLAVTIVEDAWISAEHIHQLLLAAAISQADADYFPTESQLVLFLKMGLEALESDRAVIYRFDRAGDAIELRSGLSPLERASAFLDILKSFAWDLQMLRDVAKQDRKGLLLFESRRALQKERPSHMQKWHYLDHHVSPHVAYYMKHPEEALTMAHKAFNNQETFGDMNGQKSQPYSELFRHLFQVCTGQNSRRQGKNPDEKFRAIAKQAQKQLFYHQYGHLLGLDDMQKKEETKQDEEESESTFIEYEMDAMSVAAAIGHMTYKKGNIGYFVVITRMEPTVEFGVVRIPTRGQKDTVITPQEKKSAIETVSYILQTTGIKLRDTALFGPQIAVLKDGHIYFKNDAKQLIDPPLTLTSETSIDVDGMFQHMCRASVAALQRLARLSEGFVRVIEFPKITRSGGPDDKPVMTIDMEVFQLCLHLNPLLKLECERFFRVTDAVVWYYIREQQLKVLLSHRHKKDGALATHATTNQWQFHEDNQRRTLTDQQHRALKALIARESPTNLLIMDTGTGKTMVAATYLKYLASHDQLPKHVLFVTPSSALEGVERELKMFCKNVIVRSMLKRARSAAPLAPWTITIIEHDHMRLVNELFVNCMHECFFVLDEFHLCLNQRTQRTKFMQSLSSCASGFLGFSGTPALNNNLYELQSLLTPIVPFEITQDNFFVAYSFAINQKQPMDFEIHEEVCNMDMDPQNTEYWKLLPRSLGGQNTKKLEAAHLLTLLNYSQEQASFKMVELTLEILKKNLLTVVFLVAKTSKHALELKEMLQQLSLNLAVYCIQTRADAITLTEDSIAHPADHRFRRYDVVIAPISCATGYSVPICNVCISSIYPSNAAVREQIRGRIKRLSSKHKHLTYYTVVCGIIQKLIADRYDRHDSFASVLNDLAENQN